MQVVIIKGTSSEYQIGADNKGGINVKRKEQLIKALIYIIEDLSLYCDKKDLKETVDDIIEKVFIFHE